MEEMKKKLGVAGAIIVATQGITSVYSAKTLSDRVDDMKAAMVAGRLEREQYFVRKTEFDALVVKLDKLSDQVTGVREQIAGLRGQIEDKYSLDECDPLIHELSCEDEEVASRD